MKDGLLDAEQRQEGYIYKPVSIDLLFLNATYLTNR